MTWTYFYRIQQANSLYLAIFHLKLVGVKYQFEYAKGARMH